MASRVSVQSGNGVNARCRLIRGDRYNPLTRCCDSCVTRHFERVTSENVERFKKSLLADRNPDALWSHPIHVVSVRHAPNTERLRGAMNAEFDYDLTPDQWEVLKAIRVPVSNVESIHRRESTR